MSVERLRPWRGVCTGLLAACGRRSGPVGHADLSGASAVLEASAEASAPLPHSPPSSLRPPSFPRLLLKSKAAFSPPASRPAGPLAPRSPSRPLALQAKCGFPRLHTLACAHTRPLCSTMCSHCPPGAETRGHYSPARLQGREATAVPPETLSPLRPLSGSGRLTIPSFVTTEESRPVPVPSDPTLRAPKGQGR